MYVTVIKQEGVGEGGEYLANISHKSKRRNMFGVWYMYIVKLCKFMVIVVATPKCEMPLRDEKASSSSSRDAAAAAAARADAKSVWSESDGGGKMRPGGRCAYFMNHPRWALAIRGRRIRVTAAIPFILFMGLQVYPRGLNKIGKFLSAFFLFSWKKNTRFFFVRETLFLHKELRFKQVV